MYKVKSVLILSLLAISQIAFAASSDKFFNPQKSPDDVVISMPCDMSMVFKKVYTSKNKLKLEDKNFKAGLNDTDNPLSQAENTRYIQGSFHDKDGYYYLMAKYEMTTNQYKALTESKCPKANMKGALPITNISWFDALLASKNYSLYLQKANDTPTLNGQKAFARLPTDSEFEFALRGGLNVSSSEFEANLFPMEGSLRDYAWFSGAQSSNGKLNIIGKLKPNPLDLYDLLGNAQEMMFDSFQATRTNRLHGQPGGFIVRGGSYLTNQNNISSSYRAERAYFTNGEESKAKDVGFRLVLALPVIIDNKEFKELTAEVSKLGYDDKSKDSKGGNLDTVKQLDAIIAKNKTIDAKNKELNDKNAELNKALNSLKEDMIQANIARDKMRDSAIVSSLRLGSYLCANIATEEHRLKLVLMPSYEKIKKGCEITKSEKLCNNVEVAANNIEQSKNTLNFLLTYYADHITDMRNNYDDNLVKDQVANSKVSISNNQSNLTNFTDRFVEDFLSYPKDSKDIKKRNQKWTEKCYKVANFK